MSLKVNLTIPVMWGKAHEKPNPLPDALRGKIQSVSSTRREKSLSGGNLRSKLFKRGFRDTVKSQQSKHRGGWDFRKG